MRKLLFSGDDVLHQSLLLEYPYPLLVDFVLLVILLEVCQHVLYVKYALVCNINGYGRIPGQTSDCQREPEIFHNKILLSGFYSLGILSVPKDHILEE